MRITVWLVVALGVVWVGTAWGLESSGNIIPDGGVRIGVMAPVSGGAAGYGQDIMAASRLAVEDFNAYLADMDVGWWLVPVYVDSFTDPDAVMHGMDYLGALGVSVVAGPSIDIFGAGVIESAAGYNITLLSCCSVTLENAMPGDNLYRMTPNQTNHGRIIGDIIYESGKDVVVPVGRNAPWITDLLDAAVVQFEKRGGMSANITLYDEFGPGELQKIDDFIQEAAGYEHVAILYVGFEETYDFIQEAAKYEHLTKVEWFGADANTTPYNHLLDAAVVNFTSIQPVALGNQHTMQIAERLNNELGRYPSVYAYQQYDVVWVLGMGMMYNGSIPSYLDGVMYDGVSGQVSFDVNGDRDVMVYGVWKIHDGVWGLDGLVDGLGNKRYCVDIINGEVDTTFQYLWNISGYGYNMEVCRVN